MHRDSSAPAGSDGRSKHWPRRGWLVLAAVAGLAAGVLVGAWPGRPRQRRRWRSSSRCRSHLIPAEAESGLRREFHWMRIRDELRTSSGESSALPPPTWCSRRLGPEAAT